MSPEKETPQPPWAAWARAPSLIHPPPQEDSLFENTAFFLSDEYRGSLIKQVIYVQ